MKSKLFSLLVFIEVLALVYPTCLQSQVVTSDHKYSVSRVKFREKKIDKSFSISQDTINELLTRDSLECKVGLPFRFGKRINVDIDFLKEATQNQKHDTLIYTYEIKSYAAYSINLIFDQFELNPNSKLTIFNDEGNFIYGPLTSKDNPQNGVFWTDLIRGDHIVIELAEAKTNVNKANRLHISSVIHGYKDIFAIPNNYGDSYACENDIACPEGDDWRVEGNAVAMLLVGDGTRFCSGSLINNTANNFRGFLLTAFHCLDWDCNCSLSSSEKSAVNNWLFRLQYESPTCHGIEGTEYITVNGANFRASYQQTDFALLELLTTPVLATYAGWSKTTSISQGVGIHHPQGYVKKISFDYHPLTTNSTTITWTCYCTSPANTHWSVGFDDGTTEGGSSGSPIFDPFHRIVGQLHGGNEGCPPPSIQKYYGRFDKSWTGGGTNDTRLSNWLDPTSSGVSYLNTKYPISSTISGNTFVCTANESYTINNVPQNSSIIWENSPTLLRISNQGSNPCIFAPNGNDPFWIRAKIKSNTDNSYVTLPQYKGWVGTPKISNQIVDGQPYTTGMQICPGNHYLLVTPLGGGTAIWTVPSGIVYFVGTNELDFTFPSSWTSVAISCHSNNNCGTGSNYYFYLTKKTFGCSSLLGFDLYPNPATDNVTITMLDSQASGIPRDTCATEILNNNSVNITPINYTVKIFNSQSSLLFTAVRSGKSFNIPLVNMIDGTYIIEVKDNINIYRRQLIIKRN